MPNLTETGEREQFRIGFSTTDFFNDLLITLYGLLSKYLIKPAFIDYKIEIVISGIKSPLARLYSAASRHSPCSVFGKANNC